MRVAGLEGRRVGVWGLGREGRSVARAIRARLPGTPLLLVDEGREPGAPDTWEGLPVVGDPAALAGCDVVVRSPGVSIHRPEAAALREAGVELTSGTRIWFAEHPEDRAIGVTAASYTHLRAHETVLDLVSRLLPEHKNAHPPPHRDSAHRLR